MEKVENQPIMEKRKKSTFSKTVEKDGNRKTIRVEEVENGYIISIEKYNEDKWSEKKYISSENPFEKKENVSPDESMMAESKFGDMFDM